MGISANSFVFAHRLKDRSTQQGARSFARGKFAKEAAQRRTTSCYDGIVQATIIVGRFGRHDADFGFLNKVHLYSFNKFISSF